MDEVEKITLSVRISGFRLIVKNINFVSFCQSLSFVQ